MIPKKIYIIDFSCVVDPFGIPMGHTFNVTKEIYNFVKLNLQMPNVKCILSPEYAQYFPSDSCVSILQSVIRGDGKEHHELSVIKNNFQVISRHIKDGILFFTHCDSYYARLLPKSIKDRKNIAIFYNARVQNLNDNLLKSMLKKVYFEYAIRCIKHRIDVVIKTNKNLQFSNKNILYMPDYCYLEEFYNKYLSFQKKANKIVCLGQNNKHKQIIQLIKKFRGSSYNIVIRGKFYDKSIYQEAIHLSTGFANILIEDGNISQDEYYSELASAKYCILPYDAGLYHERTSGVAIEAMFLNAIVIAPKAILDFNDIPGIAYEKLDQLNLSLLEGNQTHILNLYKEKRNGEYAKNVTLQTIEKAIQLTNLE